MDINKTNEQIPFISTEQMSEVDRLMIEKYGVKLIQMMENAGRNLAELARTRFLDANASKSLFIISPQEYGLFTCFGSS